MKKIKGIAKNLIPILFNWLKKQADNKKPSKMKDAGIAAVKIEQAVNNIKEASQDGFIDEDEMLSISKKSSEALLAAAKIFFKLEIKIKKKK